MEKSVKLKNWLNGKNQLNRKLVKQKNWLNRKMVKQKKMVKKIG